MSATGKEMVQLHNEGAMAMAAYIKEHGLDAAMDMVKSRCTAKVSVIPRKAEMEASYENLQEFFRQTYMVLILTTLHDDFGFGETRLKRVKKAFDSLVAVTGSTDLLGKRYLTLRDCAEDLNRVANMDIDLKRIEDPDKDLQSLATRGVSLEKVMAFLDKGGYRDAYDALFKETFGDDCATNRERTKEFRRLAKIRRREDHKYRAPNMNMFDSEVSTGYLTVIATVMRENGADFAQIDAFCDMVNQYLDWILQSGQEALETLQEENKEFSVGDKEADQDVCDR